MSRALPVHDYGLDVTVGACSSCGCPQGAYAEVPEVVVCADCGLPWPSSYWREQS